MLAEDNEIKIVVCFCPLFASFFSILPVLGKKNKILKKNKQKTDKKNKIK